MYVCTGMYICTVYMYVHIHLGNIVTLNYDRIHLSLRCFAFQDGCVSSQIIVEQLMKKNQCVHCTTTDQLSKMKENQHPLSS